jgi:type II secretory pathway pseudopilin PulG
MPAFTLAEVVIAIGVVSFGLVAVIGLLGIGMKSGSDSKNRTAAALLGETLLAEIEMELQTAGADSPRSESLPLPDLSQPVARETAPWFTPGTNDPDRARFTYRLGLYPPAPLADINLTNQTPVFGNLRVAVLEVAWPADAPESGRESLILYAELPANP